MHLISKDLKRLHDRLVAYDYDDSDFNHIKSPSELKQSGGGVCWDFVVSEASALQRQWLEYRCYFTGLHRNGRMIATHTYIIVEKMFWIGCSWRKHHGVHNVKLYKEIVDLLVDEYDADESHTLEYDPMKTVGMNDTQFFEYIEESGR